ncbi:metallophosphoesterase family protein [Devosia sp.]|uniref:metallophosphoesterase family protein n=1 Tax=Devosia sp. TaxID=1871048 RepID=UPI003A944F67
MRILLVADLHYSLPQYDWLLGTAAAYDLVVIAGDLLETNAMVDMSTQTVVVVNYLKRLRKVTEVLVCSGNHDLTAPNSFGEMSAEWARGLRRFQVGTDGDTLRIGDTLFTMCPWWDGPQTRDGISQQLAAAAEQRQGAWVWVHHAPPADVPISWNGQRHYGDVELVNWIARYKPDVVFCGHVHEAPFSRGGSWVERIGDTWVFNAGRQIGPVPTCVAIDTDVGEAAWFSIEGAEAVSLTRPLERPIPPLTALPQWMSRAD